MTTDDDSRWLWIATDGKVGTGRERDLAAALGSGKLPPTTWVWKKTWLEWVEANRIAELASALPAGTAEAPHAPRRSAGAVNPPPRPTGSPAAPGGALLPRPPGVGPAREAPADARPSSFGVIARPRGASVLGPPREPSDSTAPRGPLPTLGEDPNDTKATLRPPGAVPPPPRGVAPAFRAPRDDERPSRDDERPSRDDERPSRDDERPSRDDEPHTDDRPTQRKLPKLGVATRPRDTISDSDLSDVPVLLPSELRPALVLPGAPASVAIHTEAATPPKTTDLDATLGSTPFDAVPSIPVEIVPPSAEEAPPPQEEPSFAIPATASPSSSPGARTRTSGDKKLRLAIGAGVALAAVAGVFALVGTGPEAKSVVPSQTAPRSAEPPPSPGCSLLEPAARLSENVHRPVPPLLAELARGERVAVGFAEAPKNAAGLSVDLKTLDVKRTFEEAGDKAIFAVVPLGAGRFVADRADGGLGGARTVRAGLTIGIAGVDLARSSATAPAVLWAGAATEKITDPRAASGPSGELVAFRRGGLSGRVFYGFLTKEGGADGELRSLEAPGIALTGTPDVAVGNDGGLIAFAGRATPEAEWRIQLARVLRTGKGAVRAFETPAGGPGGGSIAPSVTRFGEGWILQWTEGTSGAYQVRLQRLGAALEPLGEARLVSPKGANAGQGAVFASGSRVLSVFIQTTAGHDELWGASLECPP